MMHRNLRSTWVFWFSLGWVIFLLMAQFPVLAVTILPEGYDPSAPSKSFLGIQEEELAPTLLPTTIPEEPKGPKVILRLRKPKEPLGPVIQLKDVCEIETEDPTLHEELASLDLEDSPPVGEATFIFPRRIEVSLRKMGFKHNDFKFEGPDRIAVEIPFQVLSMAKIEAAIDAAYKARALESKRDLEIEAIPLRHPTPVKLPLGQIEIGVLDLDRPGSGNRNVVLSYLVDGKEIDTQSISVKVTEKALTVVTARDLEEGTFLSPMDFEEQVILLNDRDSKEKVVTDPTLVVGARLKRGIPVGKPVFEEDLEWIPISKKGNAVNLVKKVGNVRLALQGNLQEDLFKIGQQVKVRLRKSKKEVIGKALQDGTIQIP